MNTVTQPTKVVCFVMRDNDAYVSNLHGDQSGHYVPLAEYEALARQQAQPHVVTQGGLSLDRLTQQLSWGEASVKLTLRERDLLAYLMERPNEAVSREQLHADVFEGRVTDSNSVDVYINYVRTCLKQIAAPPMIETVRGVGYKFVPVAAEQGQPQRVAEVATAGGML